MLHAKGICTKVHGVSFCLVSFLRFNGHNEQAPHFEVPHSSDGSHIPLDALESQRCDPTFDSVQRIFKLVNSLNSPGVGKTSHTSAGGAAGAPVSRLRGSR